MVRNTIRTGIRSCCKTRATARPSSFGMSISSTAIAGWYSRMRASLVLLGTGLLGTVAIRRHRRTR
jgi:hypothetical protein